MDIETIIYDKYTIKIELYNEQIKLNITDNTFLEIYEGIINEGDTNIKPINKFYSMIIKSLNKEQFYNFNITYQESVIFCNISYNDNMFNLDEHIFLNKISASESSELMLVRKINELKNMLTPIFGRNIKTGEPMKFRLDSDVLDFRIFNKGLNKYQLFNNTLLEFNKFTYARKIIFDVGLSPIYTKAIMCEFDYEDMNNMLYYYTNTPMIQTENIFSNMYISLPLVFEIEIYINKEIDIDSIPPPYYLRSFPNLKKITFVCSDGIINSNLWSLHDMFHISQELYKKLNHVVIKNIILDSEELEKVQTFVEQYNIKIEMI